MNAPLPADFHFDIQGLATAMSHSHASDAMRCQFSTQQWAILATYMQPFALQQGQSLIEQGASDQTLYLVESGTLSVHYQDEKGRIRLAMVAAGSVVGEGAFFSHLPRSASVQATNACKLWCLTALRFKELANRQSPIALELTLALGAVLAKRLCNRPKRVAVT
ncbi:MAG: cyclic nucleotide-binding domain-containing protein [Polaromonas sp.]|uniref:Crp/Fnr family transcriptional regulator n=1 Tax=Polaromonas sp. TaxID=1869339 RepID=UPI0027308B61|nr:cyclic nucleotide-binding domain-containing protein [Polaromonas sp.]MDP1742244.1 cyclic nucleotide-binding domain-containing protein [Polaromonas sp.]MDP1952975.1 cyclic nucleotide-binding domain-containing protein [Polaromonas sp.]MDP3751820.1 cyclic nucleotide-binding domain-containing protein [Polaromonas sp.]